MITDSDFFLKVPAFLALIFPTTSVTTKLFPIFTGELQDGTDEPKFNAILANRNYAQLRSIFKEYENITGHDIEKAIDKEFSGHIQQAHLAIGTYGITFFDQVQLINSFFYYTVKCAKDKASFFAEELYKSMDGLGTNDKKLIRLVVTRSEVDMGEIKEAFEKLYEKSLENYITVSIAFYSLVQNNLISFL